MNSSLPSPAIELPKSTNYLFHWATEYCRPMVLPILLALFPTLYHYGNNVEKLTLVNFSRMFVFNVGLAILIYVLLMMFFRFQAIKAANATFVFLTFFNVYGLAYRYLIHLDVVRIKHYTFLPLMLMGSIYSILFITRLRYSLLVDLWKNLILVASVLVLLNLVKIIPGEIKKGQIEITNMPADRPNGLVPAKDSPDIYYIILDEFAGFQAMREYWNYQEVDDFVNYLKQRDFFVAEESHGSSTDTLHQIASRLNYQEYPHETMSLQDFFKEIANSRVMRDLKSRGYTIVVFDESNMVYSSSITIPSDYVYEYGSASISQRKTGAYGLFFDEFGELVLDNTMVYALSQNYKANNPYIAQHSDMIYFTVDHIADQEIASPKFVYVHLLLPHTPFAFSEDGNVAGSDHFTNWNYYIDNYKFSIKIAKEMIDRILLEADSENPPIIIIQSDHGARNYLNHREGSAILENYPEEFKTLLFYALYLPGYDYSSLPQDINPINTFPIVFNHLFDANISLRE